MAKIKNNCKIYTLDNHFFLMKDIRLRLFNEKDLDEVVEINRTCLPENYVPYFFMEIYYKCPEGFWVAEDIINNKLVLSNN